MRSLHKYLRAVGFSEYTKEEQISNLVKFVIANPTKRNYVNKDGVSETVLVEFSRDFAENIGITVCGEFDGKDTFHYYYMFPYIVGREVSTYEDVTVERHAANESFAGMCDDIKIGVSLIFYLLNMTSFVKYRNADRLPMPETSTTLSALSVKGSIMMPIRKSDVQKKQEKRIARNRQQMIEAARHGDEEAMENLTLEDMDTYTAIAKRIQTEDVYSLVDTCFMPWGVECDNYSILGEILECEKVSNSLTDEHMWVMKITCNDIVFDVCINERDLYGEPMVGRRFKGAVWLLGNINYPGEA